MTIINEALQWKIACKINMLPRYRGGVNHKDIVTVWQDPYFSELLQSFRDGNLEKGLEGRKSHLLEKYQKDINEKQTEIDAAKRKIEAIKEKAQSINTAYAYLNYFNEEFEELKKQVPEEYRGISFNQAKSDYLMSGKLPDVDNGHVINDLGFFRNSGSMKKKVTEFYNKLQEGKIYETLNEIQEKSVLQEYEKTIVSTTIEAVCRDDTAADHLNSLKEKRDKLSDVANNSITLKEIEKKEVEINSIKEKYENDIERDNVLIKAFFNQEISDRKKIEPAEISNYVERLDKLNDDDMVLFDIGCLVPADSCINDPDINISSRIDNVLGNNNLPRDQWKVFQRTELQNRDRDRCEIITPPMTVKEAKEIMPYLIRDLDNAGVSGGLVFPIKEDELFKTPNNTTIHNDDVEKFVKLADLSCTISRERNLLEQNNGVSGLKNINGYFVTVHSEDEIKAKLAESDVKEEDLLKVFSRPQDLLKEFSDKKYLFNGSVVSDDFCLTSHRPGRIGMCYASNDFYYAHGFDGIGNNSNQSNGDERYTAIKSVTSDNYTVKNFGKVDGEPIQIGFINIYERNENDLSYENFGIETARYKYHNPKHEKPHTPSGPGEIAIYPEKNKLVAKIIHLKWGNQDLYVQVPDKQNDCIQKIIDARQSHFFGSANIGSQVFQHMKILYENYHDMIENKHVDHKKDNDLPLQHHPVSDKDAKKIYTLSGRIEDKNENTQNINVNEQVLANDAASNINEDVKAETTPVIEASACEHVTNMQEKGKFLHGLRLGVNKTLAKQSDGVTSMDEKSQTSAAVKQQPNFAQMAKNNSR